MAIRQLAPEYDSSKVETDLIDAVADRLGDDQPTNLDEHVHIVLALLGARLCSEDRAPLSSRLSNRAAQALNAVPPRAANNDPIHFDIDGFARSLQRQGVSARTARATCFAIAETLDEQGRAHLRLPRIDFIC